MISSFLLFNTNDLRIYTPTAPDHAKSSDKPQATGTNLLITRLTNSRESDLEVQMTANPKPEPGFSTSEP